MGDPLLADSARALVERISASEGLHKSARLRDLLHYLCERSLTSPHASVSEHDVGVEFFGRPHGYDTGTDTIVRVQVSQLRRKLEHYFLTEGQDEPAVLEIPRGSYIPVFRHREMAQGPRLTTLPPPAAPAASPVRGSWQWPLIAAAVVALAGAWLAFRPGAPDRTETRNLDRFWKAFQNGRPVQVVVSDANLILLSDLMRRSVTLLEYRLPIYPRTLIEERIHDPKELAFANQVAETHTTGIQDATVARALTSIADRYHINSTLISARDFRMPQPSNPILLGHSKGNPWVELFDERLNFHYEFDYESHRGRLVNRAPLPGEQAAYSAEFGAHGYCAIALLPKPTNDGLALVVFGSDMSSLDAGGRFLTDDKQLHELMRRLGAANADRQPYFEVLLKTRLLMNLAPSFEIVTHRVPKV